MLTIRGNNQKWGGGMQADQRSAFKLEGWNIHMTPL